MVHEHTVIRQGSQPHPIPSLSVHGPACISRTRIVFVCIRHVFQVTLWFHDTSNTNNETGINVRRKCRKCIGVALLNSIKLPEILNTNETKRILKNMRNGGRGWWSTRRPHRSTTRLTLYCGRRGELLMQANYYLHKLLSFLERQQQCCSSATGC